MNRGVGALVVMAGLCLALAARGQQAREYHLQIERQSLVIALRQFSLQTGLQVGYLPSAQAQEAIVVGPLYGRYTAEAALTRLLADSGLSFKRVNERTIAIVDVEATYGSGTLQDVRERRAVPARTVVDR